jgi:ketosteroid isomerase-like protein
MSQENVEIVRRAFEAFNRDDVDAAVADFAPDCEYIPSGAIPGGAGVSRGPEGYKRWASWLRDEFDDAHLEIHELIDAGDHVWVSLTARGRGKQSGAETSWHL